MTGKKQIVVIDDSEDYLEFITASLKKIVPEMSVITLTKITDGKNLMPTTSVDIVFCDINFNPEDDTDIQGLEFLSWFRPKYPQHPIILMSRYLDRDFEEEAIRLGANGFLEKPIRLAQLKEIIKKFL
jgi:DNA-binding NtrC family response regulator